MRKSDLVTKAYQARSQRVTHSPQPSVQIDPSLLPPIQEFGRRTILQILDNVLS
jgi:hypothetical protein